MRKIVWCSLVLSSLLAACSGKDSATSLTAPTSVSAASNTTTTSYPSHVDSVAKATQTVPAAAREGYSGPTWPDSSCDNPRYSTWVTDSTPNGKHIALWNGSNCLRPFTLVGFQILDALRPDTSQVKVAYAERYAVPGETVYFDVNIPMDCYQTDLYTDTTEEMAAHKSEAELLAISPQWAFQKSDGASCQPPPQVESCPADPFVSAPEWKHYGAGLAEIYFTVKPGVGNLLLSFASYELDPNGVPAFGTTVPQYLVRETHGYYSSGPGVIGVQYDPSKKVQLDLYKCVIANQDLTDQTIGYWAAQEVPVNAAWGN